MSAEPWKMQGRGRRRDGRSTSQSGGGPGGDKLKGLAYWCDANTSASISKKLGTLVADGRASKDVVKILKTARTGGEVLNSTQRATMEGQLRRAGPWEAGAGPAAASGKAASRPARSLVAHSKDPKPGVRMTYAAAAGKAKDPALLEMERLLAAEKKKTQRLELERKRGPAASAASGGTAAADGDVGMNDPQVAQWLCEFCGRRHPKPKRDCHICRTPRVTATQAGQAPPPTTEQAEAEYARLSQQVASLKMVGTDDYVGAAIAGAQARMALLKAQPAVVAVKTARQTYEQALKAQDELESRLSALLKKSDTLEKRLDEVEQDIDATAQAMNLVAEELAAATLLCSAAMAAMGTPVAGVSATTATAPSAVTAAAEAIIEYKAQVCGLLANTDGKSAGEAFEFYKANSAAGEAPMEAMEFLLHTMKTQVMGQADALLAVLSQTLQSSPTSPATTEAAAIPVPDGASLAAAVIGAAQRGSGDGQRGPRLSIRTTSVEASKAICEGHRATERQRAALREQNLDAKRDAAL